jgi:hypothetical protein
MTNISRSPEWIRRVLWHAPIMALALSVVLNLTLAMRLNAAEEKAKPGLHVGERVAAMDLPASDKPTVFYHFSAACGWCERNWANVIATARHSRGDFRFVGLSIGELPKGFLEARGVNFLVRDKLPADLVKAYKLGSTPQTIVVSPDGRVVESWFGAYSSGQAKKVEAYFGLRLPGLARPAAAASTAGQ